MKTSELVDLHKEVADSLQQYFKGYRDSGTTALTVFARVVNTAEGRKIQIDVCNLGDSFLTVIEIPPEEFLFVESEEFNFTVKIGNSIHNCYLNPLEG